jgi:TatD DNase family protein
MAMVGSNDRGVTWALGLHPELQHADTDVDDLIRLLPRAEVVGEIGLDYSPKAKASPAVQRRVLGRILDSDATSRRIVSLHSRGATADVVSALAEAQVPGAVLHWFLGAPADIERALDLDVFFSVNESMARSDRGRAVIELLPPNRVLLETDAPYGGARREIRPGDLETTVRSLAQQWRRDFEAVVSLIERNQEALLQRITRPKLM